MRNYPKQLLLPTLLAIDNSAGPTGYDTDWGDNRIDPSDRAIHDWYRFVLSFPPHLVRNYLKDFELDRHHVLLDPFCGTGTTIVEAKKNKIACIGIEANPIAHFACSVKVDWNIDPDGLVNHARIIADRIRKALLSAGMDDDVEFKGNAQELNLNSLDEKATKLLITNSISPIPLHKTLILLEGIREYQDCMYYKHELLALANALVLSISNLRFGPEVGVGKIKRDSQVIRPWLHEVGKISRDLKEISEQDHPPATTRGVYKDDCDDSWISNHPEIQRIANEIEKRRLELGKTSGFEKLYSQVTRQYFGGMARHLADLRGVLRDGAKLAYVVGDQASYLRIMIRTGQLLADIAQTLGYEVLRIDLFRTRFATATKEELREEVVVLR